MAPGCHILHVASETSTLKLHSSHFSSSRTHFLNLYKRVYLFQNEKLECLSKLFVTEEEGKELLSYIGGSYKVIFKQLPSLPPLRSHLNGETLLCSGP